MAWHKTYRPGDIPSEAIIHEHKPGRRIGEAVTEIQERAVNAVETIAGPGVRVDADITDNVLVIRVSVDGAGEDFNDGDPPYGEGGGTGLPDGGEPGMVLTRGPGEIGDDGAVLWDWVRAVEFD